MINGWLDLAYAVSATDTASASTSKALFLIHSLNGHARLPTVTYSWAELSLSLLYIVAITTPGTVGLWRWRGLH